MDVPHFHVMAFPGITCCCWWIKLCFVWCIGKNASAFEWLSIWSVGIQMIADLKRRYSNDFELFSSEISLFPLIRFALGSESNFMMKDNSAEVSNATNSRDHMTRQSKDFLFSLRWKICIKFTVVCLCLKLILKFFQFLAIFTKKKFILSRFNTFFILFLLLARLL